MAQAMLPAGRPRAVVDLMESEAFPLAEALGDQRRAARVARFALQGLSRERVAFLHARPEARKWVDRLDTYALPETAERAYADSLTADTLADHQARTAALQRAMLLARKLGEDDLEFYIAARLTFAHVSHQSLSEACALARSFWDRPRDGVGAFSLSTFLEFAGMAWIVTGDRERWDAADRELSVLAERTQDASVAIPCRTNDSTKMILAGRLEDALADGKMAMEQGRAVAAILIIASCSQAAAYLGFYEEALRLADESPNPVVMLLSLAGSKDELSEPTRSKAASFLAEVLRDTSQWLNCAAGLGGAIRLRDEEAIRFLLTLPGIDKVPFTWNACIFSVRRLLAEGAALLGEFDKARRFCDESVRDCEALRHRPELALTRLGLAELLLEHYPDERDAGIEHLDFAISEFREMKMQPSLERALRHRGLLRA
jgi:hypothetical protein